MGKGEQADARRPRPSKWHRFIKRHKMRRERREAKKDPECNPEYRRYDGWES